MGSRGSGAVLYVAILLRLASLHATLGKLNEPQGTHHAGARGLQLQEQSPPPPSPVQENGTWSPAQQALISDMSALINTSLSQLAFRYNMNNRKYQWKCMQSKSVPMNVVGGKVGLTIMSSRAENEIRRNLLRLIQTPGGQFDIVFAVGFPDGPSYLHDRVCEEQKTTEDLLLVDCLESRDQGKWYYTFKKLLGVLTSTFTAASCRFSYKYIITVDDDTYVHYPHLNYWITEYKSKELGGPVLGYGKFGTGTSFHGFSYNLFVMVAERMEPRFSGGYNEDKLMELWMDLYGPNHTLDVSLGSRLVIIVDSLAGADEKGMAIVAEELTKRARTLIFLQSKDQDGWMPLVRAFQRLAEKSEDRVSKQSRFGRSLLQVEKAPPAISGSKFPDHAGLKLHSTTVDRGERLHGEQGAVGGGTGLRISRRVQERTASAKRKLLEDPYGLESLSPACVARHRIRDDLLLMLHKHRHTNYTDAAQAQAHRMSLNSSQYHWRCNGSGEPWNLQGGKLGLVFVYTKVDSVLRRHILRREYRRYADDFDVAFAVGFPTETGPLAAQTCEEQRTHGDMLLVNCVENHNEGKMYHAVKQLRLLLHTRFLSSESQQGIYKYIIKLDDDTYVYLPHLSLWMGTVRAKELSASNATMFGAPLAHYYYGSFNGFSTDLFMRVVDRIEWKYMGGVHEDWLLGAWMRLYGPKDICDIAFSPQSYIHIDKYDRNPDIMASQVINQSTTLIFFHTKVLEDWQYLVEVLEKELRKQDPHDALTALEQLPDVEHIPTAWMPLD